MAKPWNEVCAKRLEEAMNEELRAHHRYVDKGAPAEISAPYKERGLIYKQGVDHLLQLPESSGDKPGG